LGALEKQRTLFQTFDAPEDTLALDGGKTFSPYTVAYQTWGQLNADRSNAILIFHALSGDSHVAGEHEDGRIGWWDLMVGPGRAFDTDRFFIICANVLGGCKGSTGPSSINPATGKPYGMDFPVLTLHDMVRAQRPLLRELGIEKLHAVKGASMGGMLALAFTQLYPELTDHVIVMAAGHSNHAQAIAWNKIGRRAIMNDPHWHHGNYYDSPDGPPKRGLAIARMIGHVTYISEGAMDRKFGRTLQSSDKQSFTFDVDYSVESYLTYQGNIFHQRFDANSYLYITRAIDYFDFSAKTGGDLTAAFAQTGARFRFFSYSADWLYSPERIEAMAQAAQAAGRDARHHKIEAALGHDAFLVQKEPQSELIREFLA
jgi:homoserine O-acetyltransferase/O-succinyltransferase